MTPDDQIPFGVPLHSWISRSLLALAALPPEPPTIAGLLYPAKRSLFSGETESLKTWFALILAKAEMDIEIPVMWADLDAMGSGEILERLRILGVSDPVIDKFFRFKEPSQRLVDDVLAEVRDEIVDTQTRLFVIDSFNAMLYLHGLDPNKTPDIEAFWVEIADHIVRAGAAPVLLDHVPKNPDARGKYAIGSERKGSGAIVHVGFKAVGQPFSRGATGRSVLSTHKDRPGFLSRPLIGTLVLDSDGDAVAYRLESDRSHVDGKFRPTVLMERVSLALEVLNEPVSQTWVEKHVEGRARALRTALAVLDDERYVTKSASGFSSLAPYREANDAFASGLEDEPDEGASGPRPDRVRSLVSTRSEPARPRVPSPSGDATDALVGGARPATASSARPALDLAVVWECPDCARIWSPQPERCKCGRAA